MDFDMTNLVQNLNSFGISPHLQPFGNAGGDSGWMNFVGWLPLQTEAPKEDATYNSSWASDQESDMSDDSGNWSCEGQSTLLEDSVNKNEIWDTPKSGWSSAVEAPRVTKPNGWATNLNNSVHQQTKHTDWLGDDVHENCGYVHQDKVGGFGNNWNVRDDSKEKGVLITKYHQLRAETEKVEMALKSYGVSKVDLMNMQPYHRSW